MNRREVEGQDLASVLIPIVSCVGTGVIASKPLRVGRPVLAASMARLDDWMVEHEYPPYRTRQLMDWVIHRRTASFDQMSDLPKLLRQQLEIDWMIFATRIAYHGIALIIRQS